MFIRTAFLIACLSQLSACVIVPEVHFNETLDFSYAAPAQTPVNFADTMCCYDCTV